MKAAKSSFALLVAALLASGHAGAAEPVPIRVGGVAPSGDLIEILFAKPDVARHLGKTYQYVPQHFAGTPPIITAIATGDLDLGVFSYSSLGLAVENAKMTDLRIVMDGFQDGVPDYYTGDYLVRNDSPIHTVEDLKGKVVATPGAGSAVDVAVRAMLRKHGLEDKRDYTIIEAGMKNLKAMLLDKKVDLAAANTTAITDPDLAANTHTLFTQVQAVGRTEMIVLAGRAGFIDKNRAAVVDFLEDALRARHFYFDPANHAAAVAIVAQYTKQSPDMLGQWLYTKNDYYRDPNGIPDLNALQSNEDMLHQLGFLPAPLEVKQYVDLGPVREAAARLSPAKAP